MKKTLFDEMRSEPNLFSAWRHVKRSALSSENSDIRGMAAEFEHQHQRHLRRIGDQIREGRFRFDDVTGVLKDKKKRLAAGKDPRPITVATLKNRIVQRAILQVLQPRKARDVRDIDTRYEAWVDPRLGKINDINRSKYGVGGLLKPYGGVPSAIERITRAIDGGSGYFFQSDIKAFFTKIPTQRVVEFVRVQTSDERLAEFFAKGLEVNLANKNELYTYADLFPSGGIGVAQGSSLSAFAGNVLLFDLDHELNKGSVTAVRYIDDLLMVSPTEQALENAIDQATKCLMGFGFRLYQPVPGSDKAARGECSQSFNFLGCTVQPNRCVPSAASLNKLNKDIAATLSESKAAINETIHQGRALDPKKTQSAILQTIGRKIFGWQRSFSFCTHPEPYQQLDADLATKIMDYENWVKRKTHSLDVPLKLKIIGIPSTETLFLERKAEEYRTGRPRTSRSQ